MGSHKLPFYDYALFLWCCLRKPRSMGAILPSSRSLAKLIVKGMQNADQAVRVIELGAGTGGLTSELLKAGVQPQFLCVIELDHNMCKLLRRKYPGLNVIEGSACDINTLVPEEFRGHTDIVVSGMPIRNFDSKTKDAILEASIRVLKPDGALLQFTYGLKSPWPASVGLSSEKIGSTLLNVPPAAVWRYNKLQAAL